MYTWLLLVGSLSNGLISVFSRPSETKLIVQILEEKSLLGANTLMRGSFQILDSAMPTVAGSSLALAIVYMPDRYAFSAALAVDALAFLCAYVLLSPVVRRWNAKGFSPGRWRWMAGRAFDDFGLGARELGRSRLTLLLVYAGLSNLLTAGAFAIGVPLIATAWPNPASVLGYTGSALAIGAFLGSAFAATFENRAVSIWIAAVLVSSVVAGVLLASVYFAMDVSLLLVVSLLGLVSVAGSVNTLLVTTMTQLFSKTEYVGRVSSLFLAVNAGSSVLSYAMFTSLQGAVGLGPAYVAFGLSSIVAVLPLCWLRPPRGPSEVTCADVTS